MDYIKNYKNKGYIIIKKFLNRSQLGKIEDEIKDIAINQIEKFNYKVKKKDLKNILFFAMKKNVNLRREIYNLLRYSFRIRQLQSDIRIIKILKKIGIKIPLYTDIPSLRIDFSDEEKFLRGPHQDVGSVISKNCATIWLPLTNVNEKSGSIAIYEKTHKRKLRKQLFIKKDRLVNNEVSLNGVHPTQKKIIDLKAGDLIIFDSFVIHESVKSQLNDNLKLNIQFIANDANEVNFKNKYYSLKRKFDGMRKKQIENNAQK